MPSNLDDDRTNGNLLFLNERCQTNSSTEVLADLSVEGSGLAEPELAS